MTQMRNKLRNAVEGEKEQDLIQCLDFKLLNKIDSGCYGFIEKGLISLWHNRYGTITLKNHTDKKIND